MNEIVHQLACTSFACRISGDTATCELVYVSQQAAETFGIDQHVLLREPGQLTVLVQPDDFARIENSARLAVTRCDCWHDEFRINRNGNVRWIEVRGRFGLGERDDRTMYGYCVDITDAKRARIENEVCADTARKHALAERDHLLARLRQQATALPVGLVITDASENLAITEWNPAAEQIFGYSRAERASDIKRRPDGGAAERDARRRDDPDAARGLHEPDRHAGHALWGSGQRVSLNGSGPDQRRSPDHLAMSGAPVQHWVACTCACSQPLRCTGRTA